MFDPSPLGDTDPVPKTITIDVMPSPDVNDDGVVNGLDVATVATHWGGMLNDRPVNGLMIAQIASYWLRTTESIAHDLVDHDTLTTVAMAQLQTAPAAAPETHLAPIYPPRAVGGRP